MPYSDDHDEIAEMLSYYLGCPVEVDGYDYIARHENTPPYVIGSLDMDLPELLDGLSKVEVLIQKDLRRLKAESETAEIAF